MADSTVTLVGNLTRDPELRFTNSGLATVRVGIAVNRRKQNAQGEWEENTSFFDAICWREMAENVAASLGKGSRVVVTGRLEQRTYENREGNTVNVVEVIADEIGPSLRWASATVERNEKKAGGGDFGGGRAPNRPAPTDATADQAGGGAYSTDEEPF